MRQQIVCFFISIFSEIIVLPQTIMDYEVSSDDGIALDPLRIVSAKTLGKTYFEGNSTTFSPWVYTTQKEVVLPRGPFFDFLVDICTALVSPKFKRDKVGPYLNTLSRCLEGLGTNYLETIWIRRLCRRLKKYSIYNKNRIKIKVYKFLKFISDGKPNKNRYIKAMNDLYAMKQIIKMDDYVYEVKRFGMSKTEHIGQKTRDVFENIIFGTYKKKPHNVKWAIELHFKMAVLEYWEERLNLTSINSTTHAP